MGTPSLCYAISDIKHVFHEYEISDHASTYFSINFLPQSNGPRVFRAHPSLLKNKNYKDHIYNVIFHTILEDIEDKSCSDYAEWISILKAKEDLEQKKQYLLYMEEVYHWQVKEKMLENEAELVSLCEFIQQTDQILDHKRITSDDLLLELVLANMRDATQKFYIKLQKERK